jgi:preprotein translocase subunit YajC
MLISSAFAAGETVAQPNAFMQFLPLLVIFALFYFMLIRPQMARGKEQKKMQDALQKGDEVVTASGQLGKVVKLSEQYVTLDIGGGTESIFQRGVIQTVLPKGTIKDL